MIRDGRHVPEPAKMGLSPFRLGDGDYLGVDTTATRRGQGRLKGGPEDTQRELRTATADQELWGDRLEDNSG
jgi:hypothetical protein